ncbi:MAG: outer membrane protein [Xanthobacteraceae bacterium]
MKTLLLGSVAVFAMTVVAPADAADLALIKAQERWTWSGIYVGGHIGSAMGLNTIANPLGPSLFGDDVHSPGYLGGAQIGANWQSPGSAWVFGLEADASLANLDGTNTCYAVSGVFTSLNCRAHTSAFGTMTGRTGLAFGPDGRSLAYIKGGLAWARSSIDTIVNHNLMGVSGSSSAGVRSWGWAVGAGAEYAMSSHWSVWAEYDYLALGRSSVTVPRESATTNPATGPVTGTFIQLPGTTVSQSIHTFKLGVNYLLAAGAPLPDGRTASVDAASRGKSPIHKARPVAVWAPGWEVEAGTRYWYSSGRFQKDIAPDLLGPQNPTFNISRLTWNNLTGHSAEAFARVDTPINVFAKGVIGGGLTLGGKINDEDWGLEPPGAAVHTGYSNTVGDASGNISYATVDAGYDVFRGPDYKVGVFAGYSVITSNQSSATCLQIALHASGICHPPTYTFILGEYERWQSLRVGGNLDVMLTPRWRLVADVAYLPYVKFNGQDQHPHRPFIAEEWGTGVGTQVEAFVSYFVTPQFSLGAGGRYWAMWTTSGLACREPPQGNCPAPEQNMQFKTDRFGLLFQAAYKWDETGVAVVR